jgi:predicted kinase
MRDVFAHERCLEHFSKLARAQSYLYDLAECLLDINVDVILDFGFWNKSDRDSLRSRFSKQGHIVEVHYTDVDDVTRAQWINARNELIDAGLSEEYYITEEAFQRLDPMFEVPDPQEVDVHVKHQ